MSQMSYGGMREKKRKTTFILNSILGGRLKRQVKVHKKARAVNFELLFPCNLIFGYKLTGKKGDEGVSFDDGGISEDIFCVDFLCVPKGTKKTEHTAGNQGNF